VPRRRRRDAAGDEAVRAQEDDDVVELGAHVRVHGGGAAEARQRADRLPRDQRRVRRVAIAVEVGKGVVLEVRVRDEGLVVLRKGQMPIAYTRVDSPTRCRVSLGPPRATRAMTRRFFGAVRTWVRVDIRLVRISCGELDRARGGRRSCLEGLHLDWLGRFVEAGRDYDVGDAGLGFPLQRTGDVARSA
jgi:hypothetical protein